MTENTDNKWIRQWKQRELWEKSWEPKNDPPFKSGFPSQDHALGWFERGNLYLVGARPGVGKTSYLLALAANQAKQETQVYYLNLEMSSIRMWSRLYCLATKESNLRKVVERDQSYREQAINSAPSLERIAPLFLQDTDFGNFVKLAKETIPQNERAVVFIDYLGLFSMRGLGPGDSYTLVSEIAKQLKHMAVALNVPLIAAVQLNREVEKRKESSLNLSDLRGSGELENHADVVLGLTRSNPERLDINILKNRDGPQEDFDLYFDAQRAAIEDLG